MFQSKQFKLHFYVPQNFSRIEQDISRRQTADLSKFSFDLPQH